MTARRILIAIVLASVCVVPPLPAQDMDPAAAQAAWEKAAAPGMVHAYLAEKAGDWSIAMRYWMMPGAEPMASESTSHAEMILGGRFLQEKVSGTANGMPFEGMGVTGYDNTTGMVQAYWVDNMGTVSMWMTGAYKTPGDPLETAGEMVDPATGQTIHMRSVTTFLSPRAHHVDYFMTIPGMDEFKTMEMDYARVE